MNLRLGLILSAAALMASVAPARAGDRALRDFGGEEGLTKMTEEFVNIVFADPRIRDHFKDVDGERLTFLLRNQFCQLLGGPCIYKGKNMKDTHRTRAIRTGHFNAMVEDLYKAMKMHKVPFRAQNRLVGKLASLKRDIVTR